MTAVRSGPLSSSDVRHGPKLGASVVTAGRGTGMADPSTRIFRASLRGRLYRDIELPSGASLEDLAAAVVSAFGFDFDHAFGFYGSLGYRYHDAEERYRCRGPQEPGKDQQGQEDLVLPPAGHGAARAEEQLYQPINQYCGLSYFTHADWRQKKGGYR